jgi:hypothetical protein
MLAAVLLAVTLTAPFGTAEASATDVGLPLQVVITVEVDGASEAVLVRIVAAAGELEPVAMIPRGDGTWGVTVELTEREDVLVAFEAVTSGGESAISESHRLSELGVDPAVFAIGETTTTEPSPSRLPEGGPWLIVAIVAAVVAMVLVVVWALPRRGEPLDTEAPVPILSGDPDHTGEPDNGSDDGASAGDG